METLADALPKEMARVREVLGHYHAVGPVGLFGAAMIEHELKLADRAAVSGDPIEMIRALNALREIEA